MRKPYDPLLDALIGKPAEQAVAAHLLALEGVERVVPFPHGQRDVDLGVVRWGKHYYVDVERRMNWESGEEWPTCLDPLHVPYRKREMLEARRPLVYYTVRADCHRAAITHGDQILGAPVDMNHQDRLMPGGDAKYCIPGEEIIGYEDLVT